MKSKRIKKTLYRLSEYRITEYADGSLCWTSHYGFASEREGRCFLVGNILFFGPWMSEDAGFFKREFLDRLKDLPVWDKTKYYSPPVEIYSCTGDGKIPLETVRRTQKDKSSNLGTASSLQDTSGNIPYRLNGAHPEMALFRHAGLDPASRSA